MMGAEAQKRWLKGLKLKSENDFKESDYLKRSDSVQLTFNLVGVEHLETPQECLEGESDGGGIFGPLGN